MRIARTDHPNQFDFYLCCSRYLPYNWLRQQCWQHQRSVTISALDSTRRSVTFVADFSELETVARNVCENCQKLLTDVVRRELSTNYCRCCENCPKMLHLLVPACLLLVLLLYLLNTGARWENLKQMMGILLQKAPPPPFPWTHYSYSRSFPLPSHRVSFHKKYCRFVIYQTHQLCGYVDRE